MDEADFEVESEARSVGEEGPFLQVRGSMKLPEEPPSPRAPRRALARHAEKRRASRGDRCGGEFVDPLHYLWSLSEERKKPRGETSVVKVYGIPPGGAYIRPRGQWKIMKEDPDKPNDDPYRVTWPLEKRTQPVGPTFVDRRASRHSRCASHRCRELSPHDYAALEAPQPSAPSTTHSVTHILTARRGWRSSHQG